MPLPSTFLYLRSHTFWSRHRSNLGTQFGIWPMSPWSHTILRRSPNQHKRHCVGDWLQTRIRTSWIHIAFLPKEKVDTISKYPVPRIHMMSQITSHYFHSLLLPDTECSPPEHFDIYIPKAIIAVHDGRKIDDDAVWRLITKLAYFMCAKYIWCVHCTGANTILLHPITQ